MMSSFIHLVGQLSVVQSWAGAICVGLVLVAALHWLLSNLDRPIYLQSEPTGTTTIAQEALTQWLVHSCKVDGVSAATVKWHGTADEPIVHAKLQLQVGAMRVHEVVERSRRNCLDHAQALFGERAVQVHIEVAKTRKPRSFLWPLQKRWRR